MTKTTPVRTSLWFMALMALAVQMAGCSKSGEREATAQLLEIATKYSDADFLFEDELFSAAAQVRRMKLSNQKLASEAKSFAEVLRVTATVAGDIKSKKQQYTPQGEAREMSAAKDLRSKAKEVLRVIGDVTGSSE